MKQKQIPTEQPYQGEAQGAIFNFLFLLIDEYQKMGMSPTDAVARACNWMINLATDVKLHQLQTQAQAKEQENLFKNATKGANE